MSRDTGGTKIVSVPAKSGHVPGISVTIHFWVSGATIHTRLLAIPALCWPMRVFDARAKACFLVSWSSPGIAR